MDSGAGLLDGLSFYKRTGHMNGAPPKISATIITKNEESNIADCLESLTWADEIVVVDSGSTDRTVEIARGYTQKVFVEEWRGQGDQKNRAAELAQGPWIFSIDADERATPELAHEIRDVITNGDRCAYAMRRKNYYNDQWINHCGWWPDWVKRVFKKGAARFSLDMIHDSLQVSSPVGKLKHPIIHYSFKTPVDFLNRAYWYAYHQAREMHAQGRRSSTWTAITHALFAFFQTYMLRLGFINGTAGLLVAMSNFVGVFYRYMMLRQLNLESKKNINP
jgi:glycosyltransferase involved in cell wall biosynthesis